MAAVDEIAIKLGVKTGDLKAALADANSQIKTFKKTGEGDDGLISHMKGVKKQFGDFKELLAAGGIVAAVTSFFALAIEGAKKTKDATDSSAAAVREFAAGLEEAKGAGTRFAVVAVGAFNKLGIAIGEAINIGRSFVQNGSEGFEVWARNQDLMDATAKAAEESENRLAEARKKHGAEFEAITKELVALEKKAQDQKWKGLDVYETQSNLELKLFELLMKQKSAQNDAITSRRLAVDIAKTQLELDDANLAVRKDQAAQEKKAQEDRKKDRDEEEKVRKKKMEDAALSQAEELEYFELSKKNRDTLNADERDRLKILTLQKQEKQVQVEIDTLYQKLIRGEITPEEEKRLGVLIKQDEKLQEHLSKLVEAKKVLTDISDLPPTPAPPVVATEEVVDSIIAKWKGFQLSVSNQGDVRNLSDPQLNALIGRLQDQIDREKTAALNRVKQPFDLTSGESAATSVYRANLTDAVKEQTLRSQFKGVVDRYGIGAAESSFAPNEFQRISGLINPDTQKQQASDIKSIATTLKNVFPKQAADIRG